MSPKFSIVIPTRDRPETFRHTLNTVCAQSGDDYEIVVADNCCGPETQLILKQCNHPGLVHIRADHVLPMTENWENGLRACKGEYITILGDDDALLLDCLDITRTIIEATRTRILGWSVASYTWPDSIMEWQQNVLFLNIRGEVVEIASREMLGAYFSGTVDFMQLPMIYNSFIHRDYIQEIRERYDEQYFVVPHCPDVVSGIINLVLDDTFVWSNRHLSIRGNSGKSTGAAHFMRSKGKALQTQFLDQEKTSLKNMMHPDLVPSHNLVIALANVSLKCKELLFPDDPEIQVDIRNVLQETAVDLVREPEAYDENLADLMALAIKHGIGLDPKTIPPKPPFMERQRPPRGARFEAGGKYLQLTVDGNVAGFRDVEAAARLASTLLPAVG